MLSEGPKDEESVTAWRNNMQERSPNSNVLWTWSWDIKPLFLSASGLTERRISLFMLKSWRTSHHCSLPWIMWTTHGGCQSISEIWSPCPTQSMMSLRIFLTGSFLRQVTDSLQSHLIKLINGRTRLWKVLVELLDSQKALWLFNDGCSRTRDVQAAKAIRRRIPSWWWHRDPRELPASWAGSLNTEDLPATGCQPLRYHQTNGQSLLGWFLRSNNSWQLQLRGWISGEPYCTYWRIQAENRQELCLECAWCAQPLHPWPNQEEFSSTIQ